MDGWIGYLSIKPLKESVGSNTEFTENHNYTALYKFFYYYYLLIVHKKASPLTNMRRHLCNSVLIEMSTSHYLLISFITKIANVFNIPKYSQLHNSFFSPKSQSRQRHRRRFSFIAGKLTKNFTNHYVTDQTNICT